MRLKSFFWQVFFAIALMCVSSILLFDALERATPNTRMAIFLTLVPVLAVGFFMAYRLSRPLESLRHHLKKMASGDISDRMQSLRTEVVEIHELVSAVESVRDQLQQRFHTILTQKSEQDALFESMVEGVVALDHNHVILHFNPAAGQILGVTAQFAIGRSIYDVIRVKEVLDTVDETIAKRAMVEKDVELAGKKEKFLQLHASPMRMANQDALGVVLVFSDVTRLRELEGMRKNFVSNVSHELRTPLTSIQGFAETLLNPAVKDPEEIKKFLQIIQRHAARLGRIIEDILALSRIERDAESNQIELKMDFIKPTLVNAIELCQLKAEKKKINLSLNCSEDIKTTIDPYLLEQAVVNLIDNAIRYSEENQPVLISAQIHEQEILIRVKDHGPGIGEKHLPRIFERFYRVDKARSRDQGGTGLGLAIVKHISIAHKGRIEVQSQLGHGSEFIIHLPYIAAEA